MNYKDYKPEKEMRRILDNFDKSRLSFEDSVSKVSGRLSSVEWGLKDVQTNLAKVEVAKKLESMPVDTMGCHAVKMKAVIFDLDDTLMGAVVNDAQTHKMLRNLMFTREQCGGPKLFVVSFTYGKEQLIQKMKENVLYEYFDGVYDSSDNKSSQVRRIMQIARAKPEETLFIGHDLIYDFQGIKENPITAGVNIRLIEPRVSINDSPVEKIAGPCYIPDLSWRIIKTEIAGLSSCVENKKVALDELKLKTGGMKQGWFGLWGEGKEIKGTSSDTEKVGKARSLFSFLSRNKDKHPQERGWDGEEIGSVQKAVDKKWPRKNIWNKEEEEYEKQYY